MEDLGYETHNEMLNLGSISIFMAYYFFKMMVYGFLCLLSRFSDKADRVKRFVRDGLFFNSVLSLLLEANFELLISGYLQLRAPLKSVSGEITSIGYGWLTVMLIALFLPVAQVYVLVQPRSVLESTTFKESWSDLYEEIKTSDKWSLSYFLLFVLRRILYVLIAFLPISQVTWQVLSIQFITLF